jgi:hypothetical protein
MEDFVQRMHDEWIELNERADKLSDFIANKEKFEKVDKDEQELLFTQYHAMCIYRTVLGNRIKKHVIE